MTDHSSDKLDPQALIRDTLAHLEHLLPGQGPILDFVHHNTIHGFQHKPFFTALAEYEELTGISGFQSEQVDRAFFRQGRITEQDLNGALDNDGELDAGALLCTVRGRPLARKALYRVALLQDLPDLTPAQLQWQLEHEGLTCMQAGVDTVAAASCKGEHASIAGALGALWHAITQKLAVSVAFPHAEDYSAEIQDMHRATGGDSHSEVENTFARIGSEWSLRTLVLQLSGIDVLDTIRPELARLGASLLDEGLARWHVTDEGTPGLYQAWRKLGGSDLQPLLLELEGAADLLRALPDDAWQALHSLLQDSGIPQARWGAYLERIALELPGWAGQINWRQRHPRYHTANPGEPRLEDFLAIRLALDKLLLDKLCKDLWHCKGNYQSLLSHFLLNTSELHVRLMLYGGRLPEYLTRAAENLIIQVDAQMPGHAGWDALAARIGQWQAASAGNEAAPALACGKIWRLFCMCQHLGLAAADVYDSGSEALQALLQLLEDFTPAARGRIWLQAFENHYRDEVLTALTANQQRGGWLQRRERPQAQIVMCMDEREESFRRNLEELNPRIATLGAAGFFGIPMQYQGLDSVHGTPLCPVVVTPAHKVDEIARAGQQRQLDGHRRGWRRLQGLVSLLHQHLRLNPLLAWLVINLSAPLMLLVQLLESLLPGLHLALAQSFRRALVPEVSTELKLTAAANERGAEGQLHPGFTFTEQSERVSGLLRTLGLTADFAPLVAFAGHGSTSLNNPHEAAHDCGACGGRQGGPNARAFAAMANRKEVRALLVAQGIHIPDDCWFVGMQHDTCSDAITWYDTDLVPASLRDRFENFRNDIRRAQELSAHERSRRFATARQLDTSGAFRHVTLRAQDGSQVRPEYGHATNAAAVIGRRQLTQGVFLDRRVFLISYDPTSDESGKILENILLTAGPVGAGINLEYYFSTIDNERFGCGTKIPHNVTGLFGVMEGATSDLRTGLPLQMVEIHEAMRLQVIVEARTSVLARIYGEHPALQELIGGGWLLVTAIDPDTSAITVFDPARGFVPWQAGDTALPVRDKSVECYARRSNPVSPMLIRQPVLAGV